LGSGSHSRRQVLSDPARTAERTLRITHRDRMPRPHRLAGFSYLGCQRYFLTFCTLHRALRFVRDDIVDDVLLQIRRTAAHEGYENVTYCFMPDHLHLLIEATHDRADLRRYVKLAKQRSGAAHALKCGARLWQEGYYDRVLRKDEDSKAIAKYILENPVRAGLVASVMDYPFSGSDRWSRTELLTLWD